MANQLDKDLASLGLDHIWTCVDYLWKLERAVGWRAWLPQAAIDIKKAVLYLYGEALDGRAKRLNAGTLWELADEIKPCDTVISFNWDTVIERVIQKRGGRLGAFCGCLRDDCINLVKPHGSTSWEFRDGHVISAAPDFEPRFEFLAESEIAARRFQIFLGAVPIKSELIVEVQELHGARAIFDTVMLHWSAVVAAVRDADRIVSVGYSFPPEDQYGNFIFGEAMRARTKVTDLEVAFYERDSVCPRNRTSESIKAAFLNRVGEPEYRGEVKGSKAP